jgi:hypothetical protein
MTGSADHTEGRLCDQPGAGRHIEHTLTRRDTARFEQERNEMDDTCANTCS